MPTLNGAKTAAEMMRSGLYGATGFVPSSTYPNDPVELRDLPGQFGHVITEEDLEVEAARYRLERALLKPDNVSFRRAKIPNRHTFSCDGMVKRASPA